MNIPKLTGNRKKAALFLIPVVIGFLIFFIAGRKDQSLKQNDSQRRAVPVEILTVTNLSLTPKVSGFGSVQPTESWDGVAEIAGKIIQVHPRLKKGAFLKKGTLLVEIDPADYELAVRQAEANLASARAQLTQMKGTEKNTKASLKIEQKSLVFAEKELKRLKALARQGAGSAKAVDQQERTVLSSRQSVQNLKSSVDKLPTERKVLEAQIAVSNANLETAKRNLERSKLILPFDARIAEANVQASQYAKAGEILVIADGLEQVDITAQFVMGKMINLFSPDSNMERLPEGNVWKDQLGIQAEVSLTSGRRKVFWDAEVIGSTDSLDSKSQTVGVIVSVKDSYKQARPGLRPPLTKNMFVEVTLKGKPQVNQKIVPRSAIHNDKIYLMNQEGRLESRNIVIDFFQDKLAVIKEGLAEGDKVVLTDISPAIDGMLLQAEMNPEALENIRKSAAGE